MKNFLIDLVLVLLILVMATTFFSKDSLNDQKLNKTINEFETTVTNNEVLEDSYITTVNEEENKLSKATKQISDTTVSGIKMVVQLFGEVIDSIFN